MDANLNIIGFRDSGIDVQAIDDTDIEVTITNNGKAPLAGAAGLFPTEAIIGSDDGIEIESGDVLNVLIQLNGDIVGAKDDAIFIDGRDELDILIDKNGVLKGGADDQGFDLDGFDNAHMRITNNGVISGGEDGGFIEVDDDAEILIQGNSPDGTILGGFGDGLDIEVVDDSDIRIIDSDFIHGGGEGPDGINIFAEDSTRF